MQLPDFPYRRLIGAAALACATALIPAAALAATTSPAAPAGATVPASFQPAAASFYTPASGVVLGGVGCTTNHACSARLVATADGGAHWRFLTAPDISLSTVNQVAFVSRRDGWLYQQYGRGLWATHDGGARWHRISLPGDVLTVAASAGTVYAVVRRPAVDELFSSPAGRDAWARVGTMTGTSLGVSGKAAWFGTSTVGTSTYLWATADGVHWHRYPFRCPGVYYGLSGIAAASPSQVAFLCANAEGMFHTQKEVLRSVNGGRTEHLTGQAPMGGDVYGFAGPPRRPRVITIAVVTPGPDYLYRSANGGKTWAEIAIPGTSGGVGLGSLSYASPEVGFVVAGQPGPGLHQLLRTTDAGATWHKVPIPAAPARPVTAYVANSNEDVVVPIDTATNKALPGITVGFVPTMIAITPNGKTAYVAVSEMGSAGILVPIDTATGKALKAIRIPAGDIAITPNGKTAYVDQCCTNGGDLDTVTPVSTATNKPGKPIKVGDGADTISITPDGKTAYVAAICCNGLGDTVTPISTADNEALKPITVGTFPGAIVFTPNSKTGYVSDGSGVTPIDTATNKALKPIKIKDTGDIAITPDGKTAYVISGPDAVIPIDTTTNKALKAIKIGSCPCTIAITPNGNTAYVVNWGPGTVTPINTTTNKAGKAIKVGLDPAAIAITPDGRTAYVVNLNSGTVTPISTATNTALKAIKIGDGAGLPDYIAITP